MSEHHIRYFVFFNLSYGRVYYQYDESRLSACTLPIHGLLHIAQDIRFCGPVWTSWTFYMERYCSLLQMGLQSRRFPWSGLNRRILHTAYLSTVSIKFDLDNEFKGFRSRNTGEVSRNERQFDGCELVLPYSVDLCLIMHHNLNRSKSYPS